MVHVGGRMLNLSLLLENYTTMIIRTEEWKGKVGKEEEGGSPVPTKLYC